MLRAVVPHQEGTGRRLCGVGICASSSQALVIRDAGGGSRPRWAGKTSTLGGYPGNFVPGRSRWRRRSAFVMDVAAALLPPAVAAGVFIAGVVFLLRHEMAPRKRKRAPRDSDER